ncbi:hypothetical protein FB451DRAFT_672232 [Mycena latifolia]|nr:hypothetical protein FB451DRAFT_672232 [Mycena latifolia]
MSVPMSNPPVVAPDVTLFFGPFLIGVLLNTMLYGIMVVQAYLYYHRYRSDRTWFRYFVLYLFIMETANWVLDVGLIYEPLIIRYGTPEALTVSPILLRPDAIITVFISTPIQFFFAWRISVITESWIMPMLISMLAIASFGGGAATTTIVTLNPDFASFGSFHAEVNTWLISSAACDVVVTSSLVWSLWSRKTNIIAMDSYINKIIRLSVQTGFITAAAALLDMILSIVTPGTTLNFILDFPLSKLYTNSLISTLNARPWREDISQRDVPNVLFEQTRVEQSSLSLVQRPFTNF